MTLMADEPQKYRPHFSWYIKKGTEADGIERLHKMVLAAVRVDPAFRTDKEPPKEHVRCYLKTLMYEERMAEVGGEAEYTQLSHCSLLASIMKSTSRINVVHEAYERNHFWPSVQFWVK